MESGTGNFAPRKRTREENQTAFEAPDLSLEEYVFRVEALIQ